MKHSLPPLDSLKVFEAAARHLSFSLAAEELCISKGAVSYQIRKLETHINASLFKRYTRQVYLTEVGQELLRTVQIQFAELEKTLSQINNDRSAKSITIAATTYVAARWLSPRIARFNHQHPDITVVFHHSVNSAQFKLQDVDLAIRWGAMNTANSDHHLKLPMPLFPACSPDLLSRFDVTQHVKSLEASSLHKPPLNKLPLLCEDRALDHWQTWYGNHDHKLNNPRHVISDANVRVQAAIDGQGLIMADELMQSELDSGLLITPFKEALQGYGYNLMHQPTLASHSKAKLLYDWLSDEYQS